MKKYYHATPSKNLLSIIREGIKAGCDGVVYLAKTKEDALKFVCIRCFANSENIVVLEVELPEDKVFETFDHNQQFFKCKAYGYTGNIPEKAIQNIWEYRITDEDVK